MQKEHSKDLVRASISFPPDIYQNLKEIARLKKVSLAWVVREAAEKYVAGEVEDSRFPRASRGPSDRRSKG
jgi:predicted DNA-binding protein